MQARPVVFGDTGRKRSRGEWLRIPHNVAGVAICMGRDYQAENRAVSAPKQYLDVIRAVCLFLKTLKKESRLARTSAGALQNLEVNAKPRYSDYKRICSP